MFLLVNITVIYSYITLMGIALSNIFFSQIRPFQRSATDLRRPKRFPDVLHFCMPIGQAYLAEWEAMELDNPWFLIIPLYLHGFLFL